MTAPIPRAAPTLSAYRALRARGCRALRALVVLLVFAVVVALRAGAQTTAAPSGFEAAFAAYEAGEPAADALAAVAADEAQPVADRFNARYVLAVLALAESRPLDALDELDAADALVPGRLLVALRRVEALLDLGERHRAETLLDELRDPTPEDGAAAAVRHALARARVEQERGEREAATARLEALEREHPAEWEVPFRLGRLYELADRPAAAMHAYDRALARAPARDPHPSVYALQRWAALSISSDPGSYADAERVDAAHARYAAFLRRAEANRVPEHLVLQVEDADGVLLFIRAHGVDELLRRARSGDGPGVLREGRRLREAEAVEASTGG